MIYYIFRYIMLSLQSSDLMKILRSSSDTRILSTPNVILKSYGQRSFAYHGHTTWNSLPLALGHQQESDCFKRALKTHMFSLS